MSTLLALNTVIDIHTVDTVNRDLPFFAIGTAIYDFFTVDSTIDADTIGTVRVWLRTEDAPRASHVYVVYR